LFFLFGQTWEKTQNFKNDIERPQWRGFSRTDGHLGLEERLVRPRSRVKREPEHGAALALCVGRHDGLGHKYPHGCAARETTLVQAAEALHERVRAPRHVLHVALQWRLWFIRFLKRDNMNMDMRRKI
jgi:hypothetical protein